jgi:DNA primase
VNLVDKNKLAILLNKALGQNGKLVDDEIVYVCPFHVARNNVDRKKFGIDINTGYYNCFACGESGKTFRTLFKKLKVSKSLYKELYSITGDKFKPQYKPKKTDLDLRLPEEFIPLYIPSKNILYKHALNYAVKKRGLTRDDILRYNVGYCEDGLYRNRLIIPSYDKDCNLNFFVARDILGTAYLKYLLPKWSKDVIGFELFINWDEPITIVEGCFDAISVRKNAVPLFGKIMSNSLKEALIEKGVLRVNVCLDNDADRDTIKMVDDINKFTNEVGIEVHIVELPLKDPNEVGFEKMNELINSSLESDFTCLFRKRLNS